MAVVSKLQLNHPSLGTAGGAGLHASVESLYTKIGDNMADRWFTIADFDQTEVVDLNHNFETDIGNLRYDLYNYTGGEWVRLTADTTPARSAFSIIEKVGSEDVTLQITNNTGGNDLTFAVCLTFDSVSLVDGDVKDVDIISSAPEDGQALVYQSSGKKFIPGASGDSSFKLQSVSTPNATIKGGFLILDDGRELATFNATYGADLTVNLTTIFGASPANATTYYLYIDKNLLGAQQTEASTGRKLYKVEVGQFYLSTVSPESIDLARYYPIGLVRSADSGTAWSGTNSQFKNLAVRRHNNLQALNEAPVKNYLKPYAQGGLPPGVLSTVAVSGNIATTEGLFYADTTSGSASLSQSTDSSLRSPVLYLSALSGADTAGGRFFQFPAVALHGSDLGKPISIGFDVTSSIADDDWDVVIVRYNSSGTYQELIPIAGNASTMTATASAKLPTGTVRFNGFFIGGATSGDLYALRFRRRAGSAQIKLDTLYVGPQSVLQGAAVTDWKSPITVPSLYYNTTAATNISSSHCKYRQNGDSADFKYLYIFNGAANASGPIYINLPDGLVVDVTKRPNNTGGYLYCSAQLNSGNKIYSGVINHSPTGSQFGIYGTDGSGFSDANPWYGHTTPASNIPTGAALANGNYLTIEINGIPISGWSSNVTMADRAVEEYAYNTGATWDADDSSSFGYGLAGASMTGGLSAGGRTKRVRFTTPAQPNDHIELLVTDGTVYLPALQFADTSNNRIVNGKMADGTNVGFLVKRVSGSTTDFDIFFHQYAAAANDDSPAQNWISGWKYVLKKTSGGAAVGYPVSARNIVGDISGTAVPSGYIGEIKEGVGASGISVTSAPTYLGNSTTTGVISLTPGTYQLYAFGYITASDSLVYMPTDFGVLSGSAAFIACTHPTSVVMTDDISQNIHQFNRQAVCRVTATALIGVKVTDLSGGTGSGGTLNGLVAIRIA